MTRTPAEMARDEALERVRAGNAALYVACAAAILRVRDRMREFTTDDLWADMAARGDVPEGEPRAMGAAMKAAEKQRLIEPTGVWRKSVRVACHGRPVLVWRSTKP